MLGYAFVRPEPAFSTVGNTSIATDRLASARAKPTLAKNSASVDCTSASISDPDAAWHGGTIQGVGIATLIFAIFFAIFLRPTEQISPIPPDLSPVSIRLALFPA